MCVFFLKKSLHTYKARTSIQTLSLANKKVCFPGPESQNFLWTPHFSLSPFFFCWHEAFSLEEEKTQLHSSQMLLTQTSPSSQWLFKGRSFTPFSPPSLITHCPFDLLSESYQRLSYHEVHWHCLSCLVNGSVIYYPSESSSSNSRLGCNTMPYVLVIKI